MKKHFEGKAAIDAQKFAYLANEYPNKKVNELIELFEISPFDANCAIWRAQDMGLLHVNKRTKKVVIDEVPEAWDLGPEVNYLLESIPYIFEKLAEKESDMEENYFSNWAQNYAAQDILIAMKVLINRNEMAMYDIKDVSDSKGKKEVNTYTFYTLAKNAKKRWGKKQFKNKKKLK